MAIATGFMRPSNPDLRLSAGAPHARIPRASPIYMDSKPERATIPAERKPTAFRLPEHSCGVHAIGTKQFRRTRNRKCFS